MKSENRQRPPRCNYVLPLGVLLLSACTIPGIHEPPVASVGDAGTSNTREPGDITTSPPEESQPTATSQDEDTEKPRETDDREDSDSTSAPKPASESDTSSHVESDVTTSGSAESTTETTSTGPEATSEPEVESGPKFHVFLLLGQSNMAGYPKVVPADLEANERIRVFGYDNCAATGRKFKEWAVAVPPLHECWTGAIGPADYFAKTLIEAIPPEDSIGLIPCAVSGERIETFMKGVGPMYNWILTRSREALEGGGEIEGILMHQGESNTGDPAWPEKVNTLVTDLRMDLELGDVPFLAGELPYDGNSASHNPLVNQLAQVIDNTWIVSAEGLIVDPADTQWNLHFDHGSQVMLGQRYAEVMKTALGWQ